MGLTEIRAAVVGPGPRACRLGRRGLPSLRRSRRGPYQVSTMRDTIRAPRSTVADILLCSKLPRNDYGAHAAVIDASKFSGRGRGIMAGRGASSPLVRLLPFSSLDHHGRATPGNRVHRGEARRLRIAPPGESLRPERALARRRRCAGTWPIAASVHGIALGRGGKVRRGAR